MRNENNLFFFFFSFSLKIKTSLALFLVFRGPYLSALNYQNPGKTPEKIKPTLCYGHHIMDIMLQKLHYRHYD